MVRMRMTFLKALPISCCAAALLSLVGVLASSEAQESPRIAFPPMTQDDLDALIAQVRNKIDEVEDDIEEAVVVETIAIDPDLERRMAFFGQSTTTGEDEDDSAN